MNFISNLKSTSKLSRNLVKRGKQIAWWNVDCDSTSHNWKFCTNRSILDFKSTSNSGRIFFLFIIEVKIKSKYGLFTTIEHSWWNFNHELTSKFHLNSFSTQDWRHILIEFRSIFSQFRSIRRNEVGKIDERKWKISWWNFDHESTWKFHN